MKKQKFLLGAAGLLALGLTACSNEMPVNETQKVEIDQTRFLAVQISSPRDASTRADFNQGTAKESFVKRLDFFFYDTEGNPTSSPQVLDDSDWKAEDFEEGPFDGGNVTRIYKSVVPVELTQGQVVPSQVLCIVNSLQANIQELSTMTLDQIRDYSTAAFTREGNFLMSNSVYYGTNEFTGATDRLCATPINATTQLFQTEEAAQKVIDGDPTAEGAMCDIYVERVAAKVGLTIPADANMSYTLINAAAAADATDKTIVINFNPEYWLMNATDTRNFITKHYGVEEGNEIVYTPTFSQINSGLSGTAVFTLGEYTSGGASWGTWNDPNNHRSYWGNSVSYFKDQFPFCSDQVNDLDGNTNNYSDPTLKDGYPVKYYSYNEISDNLGSSSSQPINKQAIVAANGRFTAGADGTTGYIYTRETTTPGRTIRNIETGNPAAAVASAVVLGRYTVNGATAPATPAATPSFWVDRNSGVIDGKTVGTYYATETSAKAALISRQVVVYTAKEAGEADENIAKNADLFVIAHPKYAVRKLLANPNIAGRLVALQLASVPATPHYYFNADGEYEEITAENIDDVNMQLITAGYMDYFDTGLAFFSIPIRHLNWQNNQTLVGAGYPLYANGQYNWNAFLTGSLGIVRNHIYNITVDNINGLGNALRSPAQPIVPAKDAVNQFIAMRLNILSWNMVPAWSLDL